MTQFITGEIHGKPNLLAKAKDAKARGVTRKTNTKDTKGNTYSAYNNGNTYSGYNIIIHIVHMQYSNT